MPEGFAESFQVLHAPWWRAFLVWGGGLEWAFIEPLPPVRACRTPSGGPEAHSRREIVDALRCIVGCFMPVATMGSSPSYMWKPDEHSSGGCG
ncbi:transposase [Streptomyces rochei]|nr:transposase [Streptomyces rochei]